PSGPSIIAGITCLLYLYRSAPIGLVVVARALRDRLLAHAARVADHYLVGGVALARPRQPAAVGRPCRLVVLGREMGQVGGRPARRGHNEDVASLSDGPVRDPISIRREPGRAIGPLGNEGARGRAVRVDDE